MSSLFTFSLSVRFFPGTGELRDTGYSKGKYYSCNFPLRDGITDESYKAVFEPVISKIMEHYQPSAIVLQCGSDSLAGDKLGCFNLSMRGHANCVEFVKSFGLPLLLLGGGGYTMRNVSRAWAFETGLAAGQELNTQLPVNEYYAYFGPDYKLDVRPNNMEDHNSREYLEKVKIQVFENLRHTAFAPSVQGHVMPTLAHDEELDEEDDRIRDGDDAQDIRASKDQRRRDRRVQKDGELSDSEDEGEGGRRNRASHGSDGQRIANGRAAANGSSPPKAKVSIMEPLRRQQAEEASTTASNGTAAGIEADPPTANQASQVLDSASAPTIPTTPAAAAATTAGVGVTSADGQQDTEMSDGSTTKPDTVA